MKKYILRIRNINSIGNKNVKKKLNIWLVRMTIWRRNRE